VTGEPWAPGLPDVARHVPTRTRDRKTPGSDTLLNTFTAGTAPTDAQAQAIIDDTVGVILADVGDPPVTHPRWDEIQVALRSAVEWQAAADIEIAYPNRDADVRVADQLQRRADAALVTLKQVLIESDVGVAASDPWWAFPDPPAWGDKSPGSGTEAIHG